MTKPHSLVMLKLLALDDRYRNVRGLTEARHDREEARIHAADIVSIVCAQTDQTRFKNDFERQFRGDPVVGLSCFKILRGYFRESTTPGFLLYEEFLAADKPLNRSVRREVIEAVEQAHRIMLSLIPPKEFYMLVGAAEDSCDMERIPGLVEEFLGNLEHARIRIEGTGALRLLPSMALGGSFRRGETFLMSASEAISQITEAELELIQYHLQRCSMNLMRREDLKVKFPHALS